MSNQKIRCYVGTDWQEAEEQQQEDGGYTINGDDPEVAAHEAACRCCSDNSPDYYVAELCVITIDGAGTERRFTVAGEQDWVWRWPREVQS
jgi:hypothetical protein